MSFVDAGAVYAKQHPKLSGAVAAVIGILVLVGVITMDFQLPPQTSSWCDTLPIDPPHIDNPDTQGERTPRVAQTASPTTLSLGDCNSGPNYKIR